MTSWFVPGRLEVFGKHTDYAGGHSIVAAVDRGIRVTLDEGDSPDGGISAQTTALPDRVEVGAGAASTLPAGHWGHYVQAVVDRLTLNFGQLKPAHLSFDSDLPLASGMSSSSALVVASALALIDHNDLREREEWKANIHSRADEAGYYSCCENGLSFGSLEGVRGVGTFGGSQDHTAMMCCHDGRLTEFSFCPIQEHRSVTLDDTWTFVVAVSGVLAEKTGSARDSYNALSARIAAIVTQWNKATRRADASLADALASSGDAVEQMRRILADEPDLLTRLDAFIRESTVLVPQALDALDVGDIDAFGAAADASHRNADENLGNQVPQTNDLQRRARELGAPAASAFGAGFGGSVWALVERSSADEFASAWIEGYRRAFPDAGGRASALPVRPGVPARRVDGPNDASF